jgi:hypothetical protein
MSKTMSLADIKAEAERRYGDLDVDGLKFRPLLRLPEDRRNHVTEMLRQVRTVQQVEDEGGIPDLDALRKIVGDVLRAVASSEYQADSMLPALDLAELMVLFEEWMGTTQPGEAQPSSS